MAKRHDSQSGEHELRKRHSRHSRHSWHGMRSETNRANGRGKPSTATAAGARAPSLRVQRRAATSTSVGASGSLARRRAAGAGQWWQVGRGKADRGVQVTAEQDLVTRAGEASSGGQPLEQRAEFASPRPSRAAWLARCTGYARCAGRRDPGAADSTGDRPGRTGCSRIDARSGSSGREQVGEQRGTERRTRPRDIPAGGRPNASGGVASKRRTVDFE